jgi:hypothetical protein
LVGNDDGGGIALYYGSALTMNGGCVSDNFSGGSLFVDCYGTGIYANESKVVLNGVALENNQSIGSYEPYGSAIYADSSSVTMDKCKVIGNGIYDKKKNHSAAFAVIYGDAESSFTIKNTDFMRNGSHAYINIFMSGDFPDTLLNIVGGTCHIEGCTFTDNDTCYLIDCNNGTLNVINSTFTGNYSTVFKGYCKNASTFAECVFKDNDADNNTFHFDYASNDLTFINCKMNESTFNNKEYAKFVKTTTGSILADGSPAMVISLAALGVSAVAVGISAVGKKKMASAQGERAKARENA